MIIQILATASGVTKLGVLSLLLTTEGLLFAALNVGVALSASSLFGARTLVSPVTLAFIAAGVLGVVGVAASLAWADLFLAAGWPGGWDARLASAALLFAIVAQPLIALLIAAGIWRG